MLRRRIKSFQFAFKGLKDLVISQPNARIHLIAIVIVTTVGLYIGLARSEWLLIILLFGLVLGTEALNTSLEYLTDLVSPDYHPLAGKAKDAAAAAVLLISLTAAVIGILIFLPKIYALLS